MIAAPIRSSLRTGAFAQTRPQARPARIALRTRASIEEPKPADAPAAPETPAVPPTPVVAAAKAPAFGDVMAFGGAAPEIVNGRLAMLAFVAALGAELASGESVFQQIFTPGSSVWIAYTAVLFIGASLIPIFKNAKAEAFGPFSPKAEMTNGRAAMIGFAALLIVEAVKGSALF